MDKKLDTDAAPTRNKKEKLDGRKIRSTVVSRTVREIPFGIDKTDGSGKSKWDLRTMIIFTLMAPISLVACITKIWRYRTVL